MTRPGSVGLVDRARAGLVAAANRSSRVLIVDHVVRYNPLLRALMRLQGLLAPVQRPLDQRVPTYPGRHNLSAGRPFGLSGLRVPPSSPEF